MEGEIPSIDIRNRVNVLKDKDLPQLKKALEHFFRRTGIERLKQDDLLWLKAILIVQNPKAFDQSRTYQNLTLIENETRALHLDREPAKPRRNSKSRLPTFERNHYERWRGLPWPYWRIMIICALAGITQGWSEAIVNGAQQWYQVAFHKFIDQTTLTQDGKDQTYPAQSELFGLMNSAPYLCCVLSIWLTPYLNRRLGRRGTIFWSSLFSIASPILQMLSRTWWQLFLARLMMGIGIGPKSATVPIYIAEVAPASIRGSLIMFWQVSTAFGIMLGSLTGVALQHLGNASDIVNLCPLNDAAKLLSQTCSINWRLMLASPAILPVFIVLYIYGCHESPRWLIAKAHRLRLNRQPKRAKVYYQKAYKALEAISRHRLLAARDILYQYYLLEEEAKALAKRQEKHPTRLRITQWFFELFAFQRNRRAILASSICMFAQQFCGVNLIVYYSNYAFARIQPGSSNSNLSGIIGGNPQERLSFNQQVLLYSMGFGLTNFFCAAPAFFLIDTIGRRTLLLCTFPILALSHFVTTIGFAIPNPTAGSPIALTGMIMFGIFYSFGEGPIPFVYAAESMPLYCREVAMALVVSINWLFNWLIAFTGPLMFESMGPAGTFAFYGVWCIILEIMILFFVPETRLLKLEEVNFVFDVLTATEFGKHAKDTLLWQLHLGEKPERLYKDAEEKVKGARDSARQRRRGRTAKPETSVAEDGGIVEQPSTAQEKAVGKSPQSGHTLVNVETARSGA